jgi:hypothetical protein
MWLAGGGAESSFVVFFVFRIIAVEEKDFALAFKRQNVRADSIQKPAVVADDDNAAGKVLQ